MPDRRCSYPGCRRTAAPFPMRRLCQAHMDSVIVKRRRGPPVDQSLPARERALDTERAEQGRICVDCETVCRGPEHCAEIIIRQMLARRHAWDWRDRPCESPSPSAA